MGKQEGNGMKVLTPGHRYELDNLEPTLPGAVKQTIQFIEKEPVLAGSTQLGTVNDGTTNEEVLKVLIDRLAFLQAKFACRENAIAITKLEEALMWLNKRTADRKVRGVEGEAVK
jgi:hypothetical protein